MTRLKYFPIILLFFACGEDTISPNRADLIAGNDAFGKTWSISSIEIELGTVQPHGCLTDNFITYFPNGGYEINEGASKCDPNDPPALTGTWRLNDNETQLIVTLGSITEVWDIESLNQENHRLSRLFQEGRRIYSMSFVD